MAEWVRRYMKNEWTVMCERESLLKLNIDRFYCISIDSNSMSCDIFGILSFFYLLTLHMNSKMKWLEWPNTHKTKYSISVLPTSTRHTLRLHVAYVYVCQLSVSETFRYLSLIIICSLIFYWIFLTRVIEWLPMSMHKDRWKTKRNNRVHYKWISCTELYWMRNFNIYFYRRFFIMYKVAMCRGA